MPRPIVLATHDPAKRDQLRWLLEGLSLDPIARPTIEVPEIGPDLAANAAAKALANSSGGLAIASDGALEVPALAKYWDPLLTSRQGQARLRQLAADLEDRRARWSEAVALADSGRLVASWTESGTEGVLAPEPWPAPVDFWVWDLFLFPRLGKVWSQISAVERADVDRTWMALKRDVQEFFRAG